MRLAVLVSGSGTLLEAILAEGLPVTLVLADRSCRGLDVAAGAGVPAELVERTDFSPAFDRVGYTQRVEKALATHDIELVAMAGFMTVLSPSVFHAFPGRILNTHPALLPSFRGASAVGDALAAGVKITGCTVHVATAMVDAGPILAQEAVPVLPGDDAATLHERIKEVERRLYPATIKELLRP
ncbi:MAG: phosphoribosylglycinamide formyltransferase [Acidimicrobiales bacterium]